MPSKKIVIGCIHADRGNRFPHHGPLEGKNAKKTSKRFQKFLREIGVMVRFYDGDIVQGFVKVQ